MKFPSGNQPEQDNIDISKSDAEKHAILQLSGENSSKLLFLAVAGHTKEGLASGDGEILKNKGDPAKFQKMLLF